MTSSDSKFPIFSHLNFILFVQNVEFLPPPPPARRCLRFPPLFRRHESFILLRLKLVRKSGDQKKEFGPEKTTLRPGLRQILRPVVRRDLSLKRDKKERNLEYK